MRVMTIGSPRTCWKYLLAPALLWFTAAPPIHAEQVEFTTPQRDGSPFVDGSIRTMMQDYMSGKGWYEGNNVRQDGSEYFVATGVGSISAPVTHPKYMASRAIAFDKAFLNTKAAMVEFISTTISKELKSTYEEGAASLTGHGAPEESQGSQFTATAVNSILGNEKASTLLLGALSGALGGEQGSGSRPPDPGRVSDAISSESFQKSVNAVARSRVAGMQAFKVFESKRGEIGVIAIWSPKLKAMADAVYQGDPRRIPREAPKKPIAQQLPTDPETLMTTFGVTQKRDEQGYPALLAFGQGIPISDRTRAIDAAYEKARLMAQGELRSYLGEMVSVDKDLAQSESADDFANRTAAYEFNEYYKEVMASRADARSIAGIRTVWEWEAVHPMTKRPVMGVIVAWTPTAARTAARMKTQMEAPTSSVTPSRQVYGWDNRSDWQGMTSQGAEGDEEEF